MRIDQFAGEVRRISQRPHPLAQQVMGSSHGFTWRLDEFAGQDTAEVRAILLQRAQQESSKSKFWKNVTYGLAGLTVAATAGAVGRQPGGACCGVGLWRVCHRRNGYFGQSRDPGCRLGRPAREGPKV